MAPRRSAARSARLEAGLGRHRSGGRRLPGPAIGGFCGGFPGVSGSFLCHIHNMTDWSVIVNLNRRPDFHMGVTGICEIRLPPAVGFCATRTACDIPHMRGYPMRRGLSASLRAQRSNPYFDSWADGLLRCARNDADTASSFPQPRSPDGAERNPGFPHRPGFRGLSSGAHSRDLSARNDGWIATEHEIVVPREGGVSSTPRLIGSITAVSGILDHPPSRVTTTE